MFDNAVEIPNKRSNFFVLGVFFLVWSINGFFIGGGVLKMGLLMFGFILILGSSFTLPVYRRFINFSLIALFFLISYWAIAIVRSQKTVTFSIFTFDVICFLLLLSGYFVASNLNYFTKVSPKIILLISLLAIVGGVMFIKYQSQLLLNNVGGNTRSAVEEGDDSGINVIGIAYTNAIIFFILYYFVVYYDLKKWIKGVVFLSIFCVLFVILSTQSRGALIYIVLILLMINFKKIFSVRYVFKSLKVLLVAVLIFVLALNFFPAMQDKMEGTLERFQTLIALSEDVEADKSSYERTLIMEDFFNNIEDVILLGKEGYNPYPHNQFVEIIMRWGLFFGLPLIVFSIRNFVRALMRLFKKDSVNPFMNLILFIFIFSFFQSLSSMSLEMNRMFWFGLGFLAAIPKNSNICLTNKELNYE
ncbi:O-antigen ligase family protein [Flavobacterium taihuense]|uniref:O-antigen ligase family protein n=1 Tax=Flavobacterium taihuense TaxID=2857508 RepID=A0ABS6XUI8_9FLAO|nr:O-antigen ligase family protein [Flavobacterium taihuense]MBW4360344.1 O-antigen ligase family protein [Flavobacterium taihuense]